MYESIDPTDSFCQNVIVYIENNQVLKIEPIFSNYSTNTWITDKGRQFFDSLFKVNIETLKNLKNISKNWNNLFKIIHKTIYILTLCNLKILNKNFFLIIFEFLSLETLNLLYLISQLYPFIKLKRSELMKINNNLESNFQINSVFNKTKLLSSSLCLLVGVNTRYENSHLNIRLRQRKLKKNISFLAIGSLFNFSFPVTFLGSNFLSFKKIIEGNSISCQIFKTSSNPILISNTEIYKRHDSKNLLNIIKILKFSNIINNTWNGFNILNSNIAETGINALIPVSCLNIKDLFNSNIIYIINVNLSYIKNFSKLIESKLINFENKSLLIDQNNQTINTSLTHSKLGIFKKYIYLPGNTLFENQESFLNTEGVIKRTTKLIFKQKNKSNWHFIRKLSKKLNNLKNNNFNIIFNSKNQYSFKNFINFQYYATQTLTDLNIYLNIKNNSFIISKKFLTFKLISVKILNTKIKYWLDDFFTGGKDNYCNNSLTLTNCSMNIRTQSTNFF